MRRLLITEEERRHILNLYGVLNEQTAQAETLPSMDITINFQSGCHSNEGGNKCTPNQVSNNVDPKLKEIETFLKNAPKGKLIEVVLASGESQVPNKDAEKTDLPRLKPGELSQMRYTSLEQYLTTKFQEWVKNGVIPSMPKFTKVEPVIGPTAWDTKKGANHPDYTKEQFMKVTIRVTNEPVVVTTTTTELEKTIPQDENCAVGLKIRIFVETHNCQNAEFFVFANNTLLYNTQGGMTANLNNSDTSLGIPTSSAKPSFSKKLLNPGYGLIPNGDGTIGDYQYGKKSFKGDLMGSRSDTFVVTPEQSANIVKEGNGLINIWMIATTKNAHRDIPQVKISKIIDGVEKDIPVKAIKAVKGKILTLDACGNKVVNQNNSQPEPVITSYLSQLKAQKENIRKGIKPGEEGEEKTDTKQLILDRTSDLITKSKELMEFILSSPAGTQGVQKAQERITSDYSVFYNELNTEPKLAKDTSGRYVDKTLNGNLYGDVRMDLDIFYAIYNSIYGPDDNIDPTGIKSTGSDKLAIGTIKGNLRRVKQTLLL